MRNSIIWQRRLDAASDSRTTTTSATLRTTTTTTTTLSTTTTTTTTAAATKLYCAPASSCPARYATAPPRRMMWPLTEHRQIDAVYSYSAARTATTSLARSSTTVHLPPTAVTSAAMTTTTSDVTNHTVIL